MNYELRLKDTIITVSDNSINNDTSLSIVGQNKLDYSLAYWSSSVHLLENFANGGGPLRSTDGQTWYSSTDRKLYVRSGDNWVDISPPLIDPLKAVAKTGGEVSGDVYIDKPRYTATHAAIKLYLASKRFSFKHSLKSSISYVIMSNNYVVMNFIFNAKTDNALIKLPIDMDDAKYSIILTPNTSSSNIGEYHCCATNKTINSFNMQLYGNVDKVACIIMGFSSTSPTK